MKTNFTELNSNNDNEQSYFNLIASNAPGIKNISINNNIRVDNLSAAPEFNLNEEKFCEPLQKYENNLNFDKINPF